MISSEKKRLIRGAVLKTLINSKTDKLPIDILSLIESFKNCRLIPYSKHMKKFNLSYKEMLELSETDDAYTVYSGKMNRYLIFYNDVDDNILYTNRYRWSLAHELGHIMLRHHKLSEKTKLFRNSLNKYEYNCFEEEVDWFASYLLAPHIPIYYKGINSAYELKRICQISGAAAFNRYEDFKLWKKNNDINNLGRYDLKIKEIFYNYIFEFNCKNCKHKFFNEAAKWCPVCGSKNITKRSIRDNMIYNDGYELNELGKAIICPNCRNEQTDNYGDYCKICGKLIVNKCSDEGETDIDINGYSYYTKEPCNHLAEGNARYCTVCGKPTTFYNQKFLCDYNSYLDNMVNTQYQYTDEEIPF